MKTTEFFNKHKGSNVNVSNCTVLGLMWMNSTANGVECKSRSWTMSLKNAGGNLGFNGDEQYS